MKVKDIMDTSPDLIRTSDTFEHLVKILDRVKYHVIYVVDDEDKLAGVLTEADIIKVLIPKYLTIDESLISVMDKNYFEKKCKESKDLTATEIMTKQPITVYEDDTVIKAAALIFVNRIHSLPVVRDSRVVGIVPRQILLKHITKVLAEN
ncbi:MAG: CBS domain-containing protein [Candidatus Kuenenia stuttgartiensis]|nr:CBS domain-containing protein [Candidatus Kuenenia stuttgartiensis]